MKQISLLIVIAFISGCSTSNIKYVGKKEFMEKAKYIQRQETRTPSPRTIFIGATKTHIYIQHWKHGLGMYGKSYIYTTQRKLFTNQELIKIDRSLVPPWPSFSKNEELKYIGLWRNTKNKNDFIIIKKNGVVKPFKNASWDITKNNGIIILFKADDSVDIVNAKLKNTNELILSFINEQEYKKVDLFGPEFKSLPEHIIKMIF